MRGCVGVGVGAAHHARRSDAVARRACASAAASAAMTPSAAYSFPVLSNAEILACLAELDVPADEAALTRPTAETVRPMMEALVHLLAGTSREELATPSADAMDVLEFPELHEDSIPRQAFSRALLSLMRAAGVPDFSVRELVKPDYQRLRRSLSAVINFAKFREESLASYQELQESSEGVEQRRAQLRAEAEALAERRRAQLDARRAEEADVEAVQAQCDELAAKVAAMNKAQAKLQGEVRALKAQGVDAADRLKADKAALEEAASTQSELESQIVTSPEKLKAELEKLAQKADEERAGTAEAHERAKALHLQLEALSRAEEDIAKAVQAMDEAQAEVSRHKGVARQVKDVKAALKVAEDESWELEAEEQQLGRQHASTTDKLQRLENAASVKRDQAAAYVVSMEEAKAAAEASIAKDKARVAAAEQAAVEARHAAAQLVAEHAEDMEAIVAKYDTLRGQVDAYHASLAEAMRSAPVAATPASVGA